VVNIGHVYPTCGRHSKSIGKGREGTYRSPPTSRMVGGSTRDRKPAVVGQAPTNSLYGKILSCAHPYIPLLNGVRLEIVVNREELASKLAVSVVS